MPIKKPMPPTFHGKWVKHRAKLPVVFMVRAVVHKVVEPYVENCLTDAHYKDIIALKKSLAHGYNPIIRDKWGNPC